MKKRHPVRKFILTVFALLTCVVLVVGIYFGARGYKMYQEAMSQTSIGEMVDAVRGEEHFTRYDDLPEFYINAVISVEDHRFMEHPGIDPIAICRALWTDLKSMSFEEGGSTITQQIAKNLFFTQEKLVERKVAEIFVVFAMEHEYSKEELFELYVNTAYFGSGYYGIYAAAMGYFDKLPSELTRYEAAMLAGVPNAPSAYSPDVSEELAEQRTVQVLSSMVKHELITQEEADGIAGK
jgi:membrane peptidoglycan carboxypeptidase